MGVEPSLEELRAEAAHASQRLALYRRKILLGRGDQRVLASRQRVADGATARLRRAEHRVSPSDTDASLPAERTPDSPRQSPGEHR